MNWRIRNIKEDWLDFRSLAGIQKRTGISEDDLLESVVKELVDNSLDECGACELGTTSRGFYVHDDGEGIPGSDDDIAYLFSIKRPRISTKNLRLPKRGCLGEGLRLCAAVSLNLNHEIEVSTRGRTLKLEPLSSGYTKHTLTGSYDKKGTRIEILCGNNANGAEGGGNILKWGKLAIEMARGRYYGGKSSPFWYDSVSFDEFLTTLELPDNYRLSHVIEEAFGINVFTHGDDSINNIINKKVLELTIQDKDILLHALREEAKKSRPRLNGNVDPVLLGNVGKVPGFDFYSTNKGFYRYTGKEGSLDAELPFVVEIWGKRQPFLSAARIFINKSPVMEYVNCWNDAKHLKLSGCGIEKKLPAKSHLDLRINIITPYVPLSSNSKTPDLKEMSNAIYKALGDVVKQSNKAYEELSGNVKKRKFIVMKEPSEVLEGKIDDTSHWKIKTMAKNMKLKVTDLIALAPKNDPFYIGTKTHKNNASWFKKWWDILGYREGKRVHLRYMHYQVLSTQSPKPLMHNRKNYFNTNECWEYLCDASRFARLLGLIDPALIIDRRNPRPIHAEVTDSWNPSLSLEPLTWKLPAIPHSLEDTLNLDIPEFRVEGYEYNNNLQPYHLEIWCEKSTMDYILGPLHEKYSTSLKIAIGFFTMTRVVELVMDIAMKINKPTRIFYISDFDPAGVNMPVAVARQIEFWLTKWTNKPIDIKLHHILLTREQVIKYELPRSPIKESDRRKANFEDKFGTGAVELDALEALHPGEFSRIVESHILEYFDTKLEEKVNDRKRQARKLAKRHWGETIYPYTNELEAIRTAIRNITAGYDDKLKTLNTSMDKELSPYKERLEELQSTLQEDLENTKYKIELPDLPESDFNEDDNDCLFDSKRDYMTQLKYYRRAQTKKSKK